MLKQLRRLLGSDHDPSIASVSQTSSVATPNQAFSVATRKEYSEFLERYTHHLSRDAFGNLNRFSSDSSPVASRRIVDSLADSGISNVPAVEPEHNLHERLSQWVLTASQKDLTSADLNLPTPPSSVHFVRGQRPIFYDFKNTDIVLDELEQAGVSVRGRLLDFGCSSGRNLAVLHRAYGAELDLFGVDPREVSVQWVNGRIQGVKAIVSRPDPPLPFETGFFDLIIAKSIWTHFSPEAAREWFREMARVLRLDGHLFFSTHGPHDVASRIIYDFPPPRYERFAGRPKWTKNAFLLDVVQNLNTRGHYFQPFKQRDDQRDLRVVPNASTANWGLAFYLDTFVKQDLLPSSLTVVRRSVGRTGNRHDVYVVRRQ